MTSKTVADFLVAQGLTPGAATQRRRGSDLDRVQSEVRELAAAGASINMMLKYLWLHHQMKPARSGFAAWLLRRGIGSSGRVLVAPTDKNQPPTTVDRPLDVLPTQTEARATVPASRPQPERIDEPPEGVSRIKWKLERQREVQNSRKSSTLPAAQQFGDILQKNRQQGDSATAVVRSVPVDPVAALDRTRKT